MLTNYAILLGSNVVVIMLLFLPNYASFLHQNYFSDLPKDMYSKSQNMNQKHWCFPYLLQINISASRPSDVIQVDELDAIGVYIHVVLSCARVICNLTIPFWGNIMLALCHDLKGANYVHNYAGIIFASLGVICTIHNQPFADFLL